MRKLFLLFIVFQFWSCAKEEEKSALNISYEFSDDVSPVKTKFTTNKNLSWSEWIINDGIAQQPENNDYNHFECVLNTPGVTNVGVNAYGNSNEYYGNLDIQVPPIANKLIIKGYHFNNQYNFNITDNELIFSFHYYDGNAYTDYSTIVLKTTFENNNSVVFNTPIEIDISGFETIPGNEQLFYFNIEGRETHQSYFRINFFLKDWYYNHRLYSPNIIYLDSNSKRIYIDADWTRR